MALQREPKHVAFMKFYLPFKHTFQTQVFGFVGADHLRTKIIINDETLEQVSQFNYLGCSISYQFSNDVEFKLAKFLQLAGNIKRIIFRKMRTETSLKI